MHRKTICLLMTILMCWALAACNVSPAVLAVNAYCRLVGGCEMPSAHELAAKYTAAPAAYEQLAEMIKQDIGTEECLMVGLDVIGPYWRSHGDKWTSNRSEEPVGLAKVLHEANIGEPRYAEYKRLFTLTGSERVGYCKDAGGLPSLEVLVYPRSFLSYDCIGTINWDAKSADAPYKMVNEAGYERMPIENGWYVVLAC